MKVHALSTIIVWDFEAGESIIINRGETGELPDHMAVEQIEGGCARAVEDLPQLDHDGNGEPGGSIAAEGDDVPELRKQYEDLLGKRPFPGWDADELKRRMAEATADDDEDGPPA